MTALNDLDRTLDAWFGAQAGPATPPEPLARIIETTRTQQPRPSVVAAIGSHWVRESASGLRGGAASLRPALVVAVVLMVIALVGGAVWVGSRLSAPQVPGLHTYRDEIVALSDLSRPMAYPQVAALIDGRVLVIGSGGQGGDPTVTAELYHPATGTTHSLGPIATPRGFVDSAIRLNDGRVLILADGVAQVFDPTTLQFTRVGPMVTPRRAPSAVLRDGRVLIAGGITPGGGVKTGLLSAELFDPDTMRFSATGAMRTTAGPLATLPDGRVFVAPDGDGAAQVYDPATGSFTAAGTMSPAFGVSSAISLPDGRVVLVGSAGIKIRLYTELWDPTSQTFSTAGAPPGQIAGSTLLDDGRILVIGYCGSVDTGSADGPRWTSLFSPATGIMAPGPRTGACQPTIARLPDGRVLLVGGLSGRGSTIGPDGAIGDTPAVKTVETFR